MFHKQIDLLKKQIIDSTCELIRIPSVYSEDSTPSAPFGSDIAHALDFTLALGEKLGFRSKNIDGFCGYIEFGEGEELVGIIGHLDVVPAGDGWSYNPFDATIQHGNIYGRGAIDDKGPVMAALYAMKAVMDSCKVNKRVRLILGTNEERDWQCMDYYKKHQEIPSIGFSPDADFPCIYAEKALLTVFLKQTYQPEEDHSVIKITKINCYDNAINVVPKQCDIVLQLSPSIKKEKVISDLENIIATDSYSIEVSSLDHNQIELKSYGIASHAAHPDLGENAISHLLIVLQKLYQQYNISFDLLEYFVSFIGDDYTGKKLGLNVTDESGPLTLNVAQASLKNGELLFGINLRIPIRTSIATVKESFENSIKETSLSCIFTGEKEALFIPKEAPLVQTLCHIYNTSTDSHQEPIAIGGATYARAFPNCISFGANLPSHQDMCHQADEYISIDNLILASNIYAKAIYELAK